MAVSSVCIRVERVSFDLLERQSVSVAKQSSLLSQSYGVHFFPRYDTHLRKDNELYTDGPDGFHMFFPLRDTGRDKKEQSVHSCIKSTPTPLRASTAHLGYSLLSGYNLP